MSLTVETDSPPRPYRGCKVVRHVGHRFLRPDSLFAFRSQRMWTPGETSCADVAKILEGENLANGNDLDWLKQNPDYFPERWRQFVGVLFLGTVYSDSRGVEFVRSAGWNPSVGSNDWGEVKFFPNHYILPQMAVAMFE